MDKKWFYIRFIIGIILTLVGAYIMFAGNIFGDRNSGIATIVGIVGISLIATSPVGVLKKK